MGIQWYLLLIILTVGIVAIWKANRDMGKALTSLHILINSRMDDWMKAEKATSRYEGHREGVEQERVDERGRRQKVINELEDAGQSKA